MPYVNVQVTQGVTRLQKEKLVARITDALAEVLGKKPEHTHVVIIRGRFCVIAIL